MCLSFYMQDMRDPCSRNQAGRAGGRSRLRLPPAPIADHQGGGKAVNTASKGNSFTCKNRTKMSPQCHTKRTHYYFCLFKTRQIEACYLSLFKQLPHPTRTSCILFSYSTKELCKTCFSSHGLHLFSSPREQMWKEG